MPQVGQDVVAAELDHLGVDEQEAELLGRIAIDQAGDDGVDADRLTGAGGAGDEQVRHPREIVDVAATSHVLAQRQRQLGAAGSVGVRFEDLAQVDDLALRIGHLDAHRALAGYGRDDADGGRLERQGQIVGQRRDLADLDARRRHHLELRDHRARGASADGPLHPEGPERIHEGRAESVQGLRADPVLALGRQLEQVDGRQVRGAVAPTEREQPPRLLLLLPWWRRLARRGRLEGGRRALRLGLRAEP